MFADQNLNLVLQVACELYSLIWNLCGIQIKQEKYLRCIFPRRQFCFAITIYVWSFKLTKQIINFIRFKVDIFKNKCENTKKKKIPTMKENLKSWFVVFFS